MPNKFTKYQSGNSSILIAVVAVVGVLAFILLATYAPFKNEANSQLYTKDSTYAKGPSNNNGGGKTICSTCSLALVVESSPYNDNLPHWNGTVTFNITQTVTTEPHV